MASTWEINTRQRVNLRSQKLQGSDSKHQGGRVSVGGSPAEVKRTENVALEGKSYFSVDGSTGPEVVNPPLETKLNATDMLLVAALLTPIMSLAARDKKVMKLFLGSTLLMALIAACNTAYITPTEVLEPKILMATATAQATATKEIPTPIVPTRIPTESSGAGGGNVSCEATAGVLFSTASKNSEGIDIAKFRKGIMQLLPPPGSWTAAEKTNIVDANGNPIYESMLRIAQLVSQRFGSELTPLGVVVGDGAAMFYGKDGKPVWINGDGKYARADANGLGTKYDTIPTAPFGAKIEVAVSNGCTIVMATRGDRAVAMYDPVAKVWREFVLPTASPIPGINDVTKEKVTPQPKITQLIPQATGENKPTTIPATKGAGAEILINHESQAETRIYAQRPAGSYSQGPGDRWVSLYECPDLSFTGCKHVLPNTPDNQQLSWDDAERVLGGLRPGLKFYYGRVEYYGTKGRYSGNLYVINPSMK